MEPPPAAFDPTVSGGIWVDISTSSTWPAG